MSSAHLSALRTQSLPFRIKEFIDYRLLDIANQTIVKSIKEESVLKKMPTRYTENIHAEIDKEYLWIWVDFQGKNKEPLDIFFEEGTKRHFVKPVTKKALAWIQKEVQYFSKGHYVSGIKARYVFRDGFLKGYPAFKKMLQKELEEYLEETMLFGR
ncbi:MAG: hypothetical protein O6761_08740 [Thaumarchaeota archaeon]|nr:hypothetical protein [Nitrososphaerota archaeon]